VRTTKSHLPRALDATETLVHDTWPQGTDTDGVIGCPVEEGETRQTILTTDVATILLASGFRVLAAAGIGDGIGVTNEVYQSLGIEITDDTAAWEARLVLRYRCPAASLRNLRPHQGIAALFHAEGDPAALAALAASGAVAWAYELIEDDRCFPLGRTNGEIAGIQAVLMAAHHLQTVAGGPGVLLAAVPGAIRPQVVVIGNGNVGAASARTAAALGAAVTVLAHSRRSAERYTVTAPTGVQVVVNDRAALLQSLMTADVVIGTILVSTFDTPPMITETDLRLMKPGAVIVDATCGYGPGFLPPRDRSSNPVIRRLNCTASVTSKSTCCRHLFPSPPRRRMDATPLRTSCAWRGDFSTGSLMR
jgi:alanine dehydrogenase